MFKFLKYTLILCLVTTVKPYSAHARTGAGDATQKTRRPFVKFLNNTEKTQSQITTLLAKLNDLSRVDIRKEISDEGSLKLRIPHGLMYLNINELNSARDFILIALLEKHLLAGRDNLNLDEALLKLWAAQKSDISVKFTIQKYLRDRRHDIKREIFDMFLSNPYLEYGDYKSLKDVMARSPGNDETNYLFSKIAIKFGDSDTALKHLRAISDSHSFGPLKYYAHGTVMAKLGRLNIALNSFEKCLKLSSGPTHKIVKDAANMAIARIHIARENWEEAEKRYRKINTGSEFYHDSLFELSYLYYKWGKHKESLESMDYLVVNQPNMKLFLEAMKIRGRELIPANYPASSLKAYRDLSLRMGYEKAKLTDAARSYAGREDEILPLVYSPRRPIESLAIPSLMLTRTLSAEPLVRQLTDLNNEINSLEDAVKLNTLLLSHFKNTINSAQIMPSLAKTHHWLNERLKEAAHLTVLLANALIELHFELKFELLENYEKDLSKFQAYLSSPETNSCRVLRESVQEKSQTYKTIASDIATLMSKAKDLASFTSSWKIMDGEREKTALDTKRRLAKEYDSLARLSEEGIMHLANLRIVNHRLERVCAERTKQELEISLKKVIKEFDTIKKAVDSDFKKALTADRYSKLRTTYKLIGNLARVPGSINLFLKKLKPIESSLLKDTSRRLAPIERENTILKAELLTLKEKFHSMAEPSMKIVLAKTEHSFDDYIQSYGWGYVSSQFELKKKTKKELRDLLIEKEKELRRIDKNFEFITYE